MTLRQRILKFVYPLLMSSTKGRSSSNIDVNEQGLKPKVPFYNLSATSISGQEFSFSQLRNRKVMIVNVASNCGFTNQYEALEELYQRHKASLIILGFPANNFKNQEPGSDEDIASFCKLNFGVSFPLFKKDSVVKPSQHPVYQWLTDKEKNGWNDKQPSWNFCKYLVDEEGKLEAFMTADVSPLSNDVVSRL